MQMQRRPPCPTLLSIQSSPETIVEKLIEVVPLFPSGPTPPLPSISWHPLCGIFTSSQWVHLGAAPLRAFGPNNYMKPYSILYSSFSPLPAHTCWYMFIFRKLWRSHKIMSAWTACRPACSGGIRKWWTTGRFTTAKAIYRYPNHFLRIPNSFNIQI